MVDHHHHQTMANQQDLAFSNPIYEHMGRIPAAPGNRDFRPVPKPRLSKNKPTPPAPVSSAATNQKDIEDSPSLAMNPILMQNLNKSTTVFQGDDSKRSSSLCLGDIRMTQLLEEINSLTDSLQKNYSSAPDNVDQCDDHHHHDGHHDHDHQDPTPEDQAAVMDGKSKSKDIVPRRTIKRKRIPVIRSDLLTMSFDDQEKISSPEVEKTKNNPVTSSADSGVFLMASQKSVNDDDHNNHNNNNGNNSGVDGRKAKIVEEDGKPEPEPESSERGPEPPKLPPRKPLRLEIVPKMDPIKSFEEQLIIDHLHNDTLSLQRSGYLWKTGPNYKSFKNRWCVLYRHSHNYFDANVSYYFNRSSMSASLSGKILLAEIECISIAETIPAKTRLPKIEKVYHTTNSSSIRGDHNSKTSRDGNASSSSSSNTNTTTTASSQTTSSSSKTDGNNQSLCFMDIGVKSRQGRVYLFAARSDQDRQQWIHAFVQAITLHAFKNKEIYQCGFIRAKFTITAMWQNCFAILTSDRFFYLFELEADNPIPTLDCQHYHTFNLRKTVRLSRIRENSMIPATPASPTEIEDSFGGGVGGGGVGRRKSTDSWAKDSAGLDCRFGFSLTQNGGDVVYLWSIFEQHINLWYKNIWRFWLVPKQPPEKLILEEQYLTKDDIPVAFDKCIKFLDTFNQTGLNLFGPMQDSINETVISKESSTISSYSGSGSGSDKSSTNGSFKARVPFLPSHPSRQIMLQNGAPQSSAIMPSDMDLLTQQKLLQQLRFDSWNVHLLPQKYNACQISQLLLLYLRSMNECLFTETLLPYWIKLSTLADKVVDSPPPVQDPAGKPNDTPANDPTSTTNNGYKNEQIKRLLKLMPPVNYFTLRRFIIYLYNATENKEEEYHLSTSLCKTLFFSKQNKTINSVAIARSLLLAMVQNHVWLFDVTQDELEKELQIKRVVNLIISQNRKESAKKHPPGHHRMKMIRSRTNATTATTTTNNDNGVWSNNNNNNNNKSKHGPNSDGQKVNSLILSIKVMITVDKHQNVNVHINRNTTANDLFDMIFEKVKPEDPEEMLNNYSVFEVNCARRLERIIMGKEKILPLVLHWSNWPSHWSSDACIEIKSTDQLLKSQARNVKVKLPNLNIIRFENDSLNYMPTMLMSVIRYCGQSDTRLVKHILAEFSSSQLFLYCKETHHLLGQFGLDDIYWYVGCETGSIVQYGSVKCSSIVNDDDHDVSGGGGGGVIASRTGSSKSKQQQSTTTATTLGSDPAVGSNQVGGDYNSSSSSIPALTFIERHRIKARQSQDRRNFGHTLMFNSWTELDQWIKGLLEASYYKELFAI